jgi:uncharacterized protein (DUF1330 family)
MMENKPKLIITAIPNPENMQGVQSYLEKAGPFAPKYGGIFISRYKTLKHLVGENGAELMSIFEFPDVQSIENMMNDEEYKKLTEIREKAFTKLNMRICEEM